MVVWEIPTSATCSANISTWTGWLDYPRGKTEIARRSPLWPETVSALNAAMEKRPKPKSDDDAGCVFLNRGGHRLVVSSETSHSDYVGVQFGKLLRELSINGRVDLNFYALLQTTNDGVNSIHLWYC